MLRALVTILVLAIIADLYLLSLSSNTNPYLLRLLNPANVNVSDNWPTYDGNTWSIKHPSSLIPTSKNAGSLVSFEGFEDGSTLTIYTNKISNDPLGEMVLQTDPNRLDILSAILELQKETLQSFPDQKLISAQKTTINNIAAVELIEVDLTNKDNVTYSNQTTVVEDDLIAAWTLDSDETSPQRDAAIVSSRATGRPSRLSRGRLIGSPFPARSVSPSARRQVESLLRSRVVRNPQRLRPTRRGSAVD